MYALHPGVEVRKLPVSTNSAERDGLDKTVEHKVLGNVVQGLAAVLAELKVNLLEKKRRCEPT